jgi:hypothetical protein
VDNLVQEVVEQEVQVLVKVECFQITGLIQVLVINQEVVEEWELLLL